MPNRLFYNLFATDGFIYLPTDPTGTEKRQKVYVFGFAGGLFKIQPINILGKPAGPEIIVNPEFDTTVPDNLEALRGKAVIPSPRIDMDVGDELYITLTNLGFYLTDPPILDVHTLHVHGGHVASQVDGVPETSFGVPVTPPGSPAISITYYFKPEKPGTYFYHCHQEASEHVQMGMYGALIVYPSMLSLISSGISKKSFSGEWLYRGSPISHIPPTATNRNFAYNDVNSYYDSDWVLLFSDIDSAWHDAVYAQTDFNPVDYKPNYWLVNGRAFPDTLLPTKIPKALEPDFGYSIPDGYDCFVKVSTGNPSKHIRPDKFLLRMINIGYQPVPFHVHGWHGMIVGKDANPRTAGEMNFTTLVGSGESYDVIYSADDKRKLYADYIFCGRAGFPSLKQQVATATAQSKEAGTFIPPFPNADDLWANILLKTSFNKGTFIPPYNWKAWNYGSQMSDNFMYPQFYLAHNHDDYKVTNNGSYPGGQLIFIETDFPGTNYKSDPPVITEPDHVCRIHPGRTMSSGIIHYPANRKF
ncbi:multicopper oxidase domain-containing protein [Thermoanaerobacterium sp. DL9XJH110]|uniref:multicopper oxidase domain-containing protein n=1 Tax=Thermoanaerobacterium sp. DL9XJH110 TaxID=3386643 RepID=UPI003BB7E212